MRISEFVKEEEQLDEILPLIGLAARGAAAAAGGVGRLAGRAALKGAGALAKGAARTVGGAVRGATNMAFGSDDEEDDAPAASPNATVGTQSQQKSAGAIDTKPSQTTPGNKPTAKPSSAGITDFRPGARVNLPTTTGKVGNFKVTKVSGNDVEIENPDKYKLSGEPDRMTFTRDELEQLMGGKK